MDNKFCLWLDENIETVRKSVEPYPPELSVAPPDNSVRFTGTADNGVPIDLWFHLNFKRGSVANWFYRFVEKLSEDTFEYLFKYFDGRAV